MLRAGTIIGDRYEIISKVGSGGMADVYKAKCHKLNRYVAIKVLKTEYSNDKSFVSKFRAEAQAVAVLTHPNIVNVYDVGDEDGLYYIVMELVEGITLKEYIEKKGKLEYREALSIAIQVSLGIEAAHSKGIIHRDIKPQNIIISKDGKVKVADFGIAKAATSNTITSNAMGSVHYISPEQARGGYCDEKSDIYSLGITMYEMVTGKVPFTGDSTVAVALKHLQEEMVSPRKYDPSVPISFEKIIYKCTQKKPELRYLTATELIADLKRSLLHPDEDFVKIATLENASPTVTIDDDEVSAIKKETGKLSEDTISITDVEYDDEEGEDSEDEDEDVNPKLEKIITVCGVIAGIIIAVIVLLLVGKTIGGFKFFGNGDSASSDMSTEESLDSKTVEMIDVTGMTVDEATKALNDIGLGLKVDEYRQDNTVPKNSIISQDVDEGTVVDKNSWVKVVVSDGPEKLTVPDVSGLDEAAAAAQLKEQGFNVISPSEYQYSDNYEQGLVIGTSPKIGTTVSSGDSILLYVSRGKENKDVLVPDLRSLSTTAAQQELEARGLKLGSVTEGYSDSYAAGLVMSQSYSPNQYVPEGTSVSIVVSLGPQQTPSTPDTTTPSSTEQPTTPETPSTTPDTPSSDTTGNTEGPGAGSETPTE